MLVVQRPPTVPYLMFRWQKCQRQRELYVAETVRKKLPTGARQGLVDLGGLSNAKAAADWWNLNGELTCMEEHQGRSVTRNHEDH